LVFVASLVVINVVAAEEFDTVNQLEVKVRLTELDCKDHPRWLPGQLKVSVFPARLILMFVGVEGMV
jgi:hypothetical protein